MVDYQAKYEVSVIIQLSCSEVELDHNFVRTLESELLNDAIPTFPTHGSSEVTRAHGFELQSFRSKLFWSNR